MDPFTTPVAQMAQTPQHQNPPSVGEARARRRAERRDPRARQAAFVARMARERMPTPPPQTTPPRRLPSVTSQITPSHNQTESNILFGNPFDL